MAQAAARTDRQPAEPAGQTGRVGGSAADRQPEAHEPRQPATAESVDSPPSAAVRAGVVARFATARVPTRHGEFTAHAYRSQADATEHLAYAMGDLSGDPPLVRVHSECLTGDILGSIRCDCGSQLRAALQMIAAEGRGVLVYLRGQEGRGIGLGHKLRAYALQDDGLDTVEANEAQGFPADSRSYAVGAGILADLGIRRVRLMTNNPAKIGELDGLGLQVSERVPMWVGADPENLRYLETKRSRMGHHPAAESADSVGEAARSPGDPESGITSSA